MKVNNSMFMNPEDDTSENRYMMQQMARHTMRVKLLADIRMDMTICKLEGWDQMEYIHQLQDLLNGFTTENEKERIGGHYVEK